MPEFNKNTQIDYWISSAESDLDTCEILIDKGKTVHGLFWWHLTIEKPLKAHYVKVNNDYAPKTHNLIYLVQKAELSLDESQKDLIGLLLKYQLEGRYPDYKPIVPNVENAREYLQQTKELFSWLIKKL